MLPGSTNLTHVLRVCGDVFLQLYVFVQLLDEKTYETFFRRCLCRIVATIVVCLLMPHLSVFTTEVMWDFLLLTTLAVMIRYVWMRSHLKGSVG